jgi:hypothetical protein
MNVLKARKTVATIGVFLGVVTSQAQAGDLPVDWNSVRASGMGGSFTAVTGDETSSFFNPAGAAWLRNPRSKKSLEKVYFPGLLVGGNALALDGIGAGIQTGNKVSSSLSGVTDAPSDLVNADRFGKILQVAKEHPGSPLFAELQFYPAAVVGSRGGPTYVLGLPVRSEFSLGVIDAADTSKAYINSRTTAGALVTVAGLTRSGVLGYGFSIRPNYRYSYQTYEYSTSNTSFSSFRKAVGGGASKTSGVQADAGFVFIMRDYWFPTIGIAVRNLPTACVDNYTNPVSGKSYTVCGSKRSGDITTENSSDAIDPTEVRAGVSITPRFRAGSLRVNLRIAIDAYPIPVTVSGKSYGFSDLSINEILHSGGELFFGNTMGDQSLAFRAGTYGSNQTYGATFALGSFEIEWATYPGYSLLPGQTSRQDRRHLIGTSFRW